MESNGHYHCSIDNISRNKGGRAVRYASYIIRDNSYDILNNETYKHKKLNDDFINCGLSIPKNKNNIFNDGNLTEKESIIKFANNLELGITSKNANLANTMDISLPNFLDYNSCERIAKGISIYLANDIGSVNAWALHNDIKTEEQLNNIKSISPNAKIDNKNMHIIFSTSKYLPQNKYGFKYGNSLREITGTFRKKFLVKLRGIVANEINKELLNVNKLTSSTKVSDKSYKEQFKNGESLKEKQKKSIRISKLSFDLQKRNITTEETQKLIDFVNKDLNVVKIDKNKEIKSFTDKNKSLALTILYNEDLDYYKNGKTLFNSSTKSNKYLFDSFSREFDFNSKDDLKQIIENKSRYVEDLKKEINKIDLDLKKEKSKTLFKLFNYVNIIIGKEYDDVNINKLKKQKSDKINSIIVLNKIDEINKKNIDKLQSDSYKDLNNKIDNINKKSLNTNNINTYTTKFNYDKSLKEKEYNLKSKQINNKTNEIIKKSIEMSYISFIKLGKKLNKIYEEGSHKMKTSTEQMNRNNKQRMQLTYNKKATKL